MLAKFAPKMYFESKYKRFIILKINPHFSKEWVFKVKNPKNKNVFRCYVAYLKKNILQPNYHFNSTKCFEYSIGYLFGGVENNEVCEEVNTSAVYRLF